MTSLSNCAVCEYRLEFVSYVWVTAVNISRKEGGRVVREVVWVEMCLGWGNGGGKGMEGMGWNGEVGQPKLGRE